MQVLSRSNYQEVALALRDDPSVSVGQHLASEFAALDTATGIPDYHLDRLSPRQWEVLMLMAEGNTNSEIQAALNLSESSVKHHAATIFLKLETSGRTEAAVMFARWRDQATA